MASNTDAVLAHTRGLLERRLAEIREEEPRVRRALAELGGEPAATRPGKAARGGGPRRRIRPSGFWASKLMAEVEKRPGTVPDLTKRLKRFGIEEGSTALYPVAKALVEEGQLRKKGAVYVGVEVKAASDGVARAGKSRPPASKRKPRTEGTSRLPKRKKKSNPGGNGKR